MNIKSLIILSLIQTAFSDYGEVEVTEVTHALVTLKWFRPNPTDEIAYYQYTFDPIEGPITGSDLDKKSFCQELTCKEDAENLRSCVKYSIKLTAYLENGSSFDYPELFNETLENTPSAPEGLTQSATKTGIVNLKWKPPRQFPECVIYYKVCYVKLPETKESSYICLDTPEVDPSDWYKEITFSVSGLEPCAEHRFSIRAITEKGTEGPEAALSAQSPFEKPSEPINLSVSSIDGNDVSLCWEDPLIYPLCVDSYTVSSRHCNETTQKVLINSSLADQSQIVSKIIQENGKSENNIENCVNTETVGGLLFCTCYDFVVKSVKQDGTILAESNHVQGHTNFATDGLESPTEVEVQSVSTTDAKISWFAPPENFNCIEGYETTWSDGVNTNSATAPNKYTFTQVLPNLRPCQIYNVTVETLPSGPHTLSSAINFPTLNIAPGKAENVVIYNLKSNGFKVTWMNPSSNPQCAKYWSRDVTDLSIFEDSNEVNCQVEADFVPPPGSNLYESDELLPSRTYRLTLTAFPSEGPEQIGESYSCIVKTLSF